MGAPARANVCMCETAEGFEYLLLCGCFAVTYHKRTAARPKMVERPHRAHLLAPLTTTVVVCREYDDRCPRFGEPLVLD